MNLNTESSSNRWILAKLIVQIVLLTSFISYTYDQLAIAEAWLVDPEKYRYSYNHLSIDRKSKKLEELNKQYLHDIYVAEYNLFKSKSEILAEYKNKYSNLPNSKRVKVEEIDKSLKEIEELKELFSTFTTYQEDNISVTYGVNDKHNIGLDLAYSSNIHNSSRYRGKAAEFYHKQSLYKADKFIISLKSAISYNNYYRTKSNTSIKESLLIGISKKNKYFGNGFLEVGLHASTSLDGPNVGSHVIGFSSCQGSKIFWDMTLSNYSQMDYYQQPHIFIGKPKVKGEFFDQFSIAKEINLANIVGLKDSQNTNTTATIQLGYFWKGIISQSNSIVSGPTISLWFVI